MQRWLALLPLLALLSFVAACSYESGAEDSTDPTVVSTTTVLAAPTTGVATTAPPTTRAAASCPPGPSPDYPPGARDVSEALGDFDGNGGADLLQVFAVGGSRTWRLRVALTGGSVVETQFEPKGGGPARAAGGQNVGGDRADEIFALAGRDKSFTVLALYELKDCQIQPLRRVTGEPATFHLGGSFREQQGVECMANQLVQVRAQTRDGKRFSTERTTYRVEGTTVREIGTSPGETFVRPLNDRVIDHLPELRCGVLGVGPL
jgi:hypothetical protein